MVRHVLVLLSLTALLAGGCASQGTHPFDEGVAYAGQGEHELALERFEYAVLNKHMTNDEIAMSYLMMSAMLLELGRAQESLAAAQEAGRFAPAGGKSAALAVGMVEKVKRLLDAASK